MVLWALVGLVAVLLLLWGLAGWWCRWCGRCDGVTQKAGAWWTTYAYGRAGAPSLPVSHPFSLTFVLQPPQVASCAPSPRRLTHPPPVPATLSRHAPVRHQAHQVRHRPHRYVVRTCVRFMLTMPVLVSDGRRKERNTKNDRA